MSESPNDDESIILADVSKGQPSDLKFPLEFVREKIFLCGVTGSGKSFTAGLLMEEINRVGLQFVCFDVLGAHGGLKELSNVEGLEPKNGETVNLKGLVRRLWCLFNFSKTCISFKRCSFSMFRLSHSQFNQS